jgi:hypothetical protein
MKYALALSLLTIATFGSFSHALPPRNVLVYFPVQNSPIVQDYLDELEREKSQTGTNSISSYSVSANNDGSVDVCIVADNVGNQYRVLEFTKNSTNAMPGATARTSSQPCP